jgi:hypothetical protein
MTFGVLDVVAKLAAGETAMRNRAEKATRLPCLRFASTISDLAADNFASPPR